MVTIWNTYCSLPSGYNSSSLSMWKIHSSFPKTAPKPHPTIVKGSSQGLGSYCLNQPSCRFDASGAVSQVQLFVSDSSQSEDLLTKETSYVAPTFKIQ